ncbi:hypothetical protein GUJ93_ZPchr0010g10292 [Zizania palustris]|uniref:Uncharacterized protein n=1 Tax=Zizania palustris TaxID=103762 RepID=A0A8J5W7H1_ZIZPA|nr:hypothetical protein GUJ93_ZPchr0010g10292 [Zizania palustris]
MHTCVDVVVEMESEEEAVQLQKEQVPASHLLEVKLHTGNLSYTRTASATELQYSTAASVKRRQDYRLWRIPNEVRSINKEAYTPKFVCIGPYHRGAKAGSSLPGEKLKKLYYEKLLDLVESDKQKQGDIVEQVDCFYADEHALKKMKEDIVVTMLLYDGCFIIMHLYNYARGVDEENLHRTRWAPAQLRIDLGLLENQTPFFVLVELFGHLTPRDLLLERDAGDPEKKRRTLQDMALWYMLDSLYKSALDENESPLDRLQIAADEEIHHLLQLVHVAHRVSLDAAEDDQRSAGPCRSLLRLLVCGIPFYLMKLLRWCLCMCRCRRRSGQKGDINDLKQNIASAAQLKEFGVKIRAAQPLDLAGVLNVRIRDDNAIKLEIPPLYVEKATVPLLQNLIAYEQQGTPSSPALDYFTTYAFLMYNLINSTEDIALLQEKGILCNNFGSQETIIAFFKNLCLWNLRSETKDNSAIGNVLVNLRRHSQDQKLRDWAEIKKYINSPVKVFVVIVSTAVTVSTILQAIYAVASPSPKR